jgi:hypothetical protein
MQRLGDGKAILSHPGHTYRQTDRRAQARPILVETRTLPKRATRGAGKRSSTSQVMHVYRNGILIGRSTVSTGSKGHATPGGVFTILEKKRAHYSKKYDNAPMPNMQRLTGPASPCIRAICLVILKATAVFVCLMISRNCSSRRRRKVAWSLSATVRHRHRIWHRIPASCWRRKIFRLRCFELWHAAITTGIPNEATLDQSQSLLALPIA